MWESLLIFFPQKVIKKLIWKVKILEKNRKFPFYSGYLVWTASSPRHGWWAKLLQFMWNYHLMKIKKNATHLLPTCPTKFHYQVCSPQFALLVAVAGMDLSLFGIAYMVLCFGFVTKIHVCDTPLFWLLMNNSCTGLKLSFCPTPVGRSGTG